MTMRFVSAVALGLSLLTANVAKAADHELIAQKFEELTKYSDLAYKGFVEKNKSKGCFAEGMIYVTAKLLTDEYFGAMSNEQASKAVIVQQSIAQLGQFCTGEDRTFEKATEAALQIKNLLQLRQAD